MSTPEIALPAVGQRFTLTVAVDRYPFFVAEAGTTGTVTEASPKEIHLKMDATIEGCEEWDNAIIWMDDDIEYFAEQVTPAR